MGIPLEDLVKTSSKEDARAQLLQAAKGLGWAQVDGDSEGTVALSGTPNGSYDVRVTILTVASGTTLTFKYSLDGGKTWSGSVAPSGGAYVLGATGMTLTFTGNAVDSFIVGDTFTVASFAPPLPTTSWGPFDVPRILIEVFAVAFSILLNLIAKIAGGGLLYYAKGKWLTLLADEVYDCQRFQGVATEGIVTVADTASAGPFTLTQGVFLLQTAGGLRYRAKSTVTLPKGGTVTLTMRAEAIGAGYNVGGHALVVVGTPLPGVVADNDISWVTVQGTNDETDDELRARCAAKWSSLAPAFTDDGYSYYAKQASPGVTRTHSRVSPTVPGQADLYLAGSNGGVSGGVVAAVQAALDQIEPQCCTVNVQSATPHVFTVLGTAYYFNTNVLLTVQNAMDKALAAFFSTVKIGGTMYLSQLVDAIQDVPGMRNVDLDPSLADTTLTATEVATFVNSLTYVGVAS